MRQRWVQVAALAVGLFAVNVIARLVIRLGFNDNEDATGRVTVAMFAVVGLVLATVSFRRAQQARPGVWLPELVVATLAALLLTVLVGPFVSGDTPVGNGAGAFFTQIWLYAGFAGVGVLLGYWLATALGRDHRTRSLAAFAAARSTRPRRVVRR